MNIKKKEKKKKTKKERPEKMYTIKGGNMRDNGEWGNDVSWTEM